MGYWNVREEHSKQMYTWIIDTGMQRWTGTRAKTILIGHRVGVLSTISLGQIFLAFWARSISSRWQPVYICGTTILWPWQSLLPFTYFQPTLLPSSGATHGHILGFIHISPSSIIRTSKGQPDCSSIHLWEKPWNVMGTETMEILMETGCHSKTKGATAENCIKTQFSSL